MRCIFHNSWNRLHDEHQRWNLPHEWSPRRSGILEQNRKIYVEQVTELDLTLRYTSSYGALDTDITSGEWVRAILVWDKQPNSGAIPTFDTIFGQTSQAGVESSSVMDHLRYDNMFRFRVLMDECINPTLTNAAVSTPINPATASLVNNTYFRFHKYVKLGNKLTNFSGTANPVTTANISTGALYLILRTQSATLTELWALEDTSTARLRYVD